MKLSLVLVKFNKQLIAVLHTYEWKTGQLQGHRRDGIARNFVSKATSTSSGFLILLSFVILAGALF